MDPALAGEERALPMAYDFDLFGIAPGPLAARIAQEGRQ